MTSDIRDNADPHPPTPAAEKVELPQPIKQAVEALNIAYSALHKISTSVIKTGGGEVVDNAVMYLAAKADAEIALDKIHALRASSAPQGWMAEQAASAQAEVSGWSDAIKKSANVEGFVVLPPVPQKRD